MGGSSRSCFQEYRLRVVRLSQCGFAAVLSLCLPLTALLVYAVVRPGNRLPKLWLVVMFLTTLVFTHLVLEHWHLLIKDIP